MRAMVVINPRVVRFKASRASGPGGQRTNRRATKVQVWVKLRDLPISDAERWRLMRGLGKCLNERGEVEVQSESSRSQELNRDDAIRKLQAIVTKALSVPKRRIPTERPRRANEERIKEKKLVSKKKQARRSGHQR